MCYIVDSEIVIANFFAECEGKTALKLSILSDIKKKIEEHFKTEGRILFVDNSRRSIMNAVLSNPQYFSFDESRSTILFKRSRINLFYEDIYSIFNSKIDLKIKYPFLNCLESILEAYAVPAQ